MLSWTSCVLQRATGRGLIACVKLRGTVYNNGYLEDGSKTLQQTQLDVLGMKHVHGPWSHSLVGFTLTTESKESVYFCILLSATLLFPEGIFIYLSCEAAVVVSLNVILA